MSSLERLKVIYDYHKGKRLCICINKNKNLCECKNMSKIKIQMTDWKIVQ
jgi:hypothetical protein